MGASPSEPHSGLRHTDVDTNPCGCAPLAADSAAAAALDEGSHPTGAAGALHEGGHCVRPKP